jgi:hypothetical protein
MRLPFLGHNALTIGDGNNALPPMIELIDRPPAAPLAAQ